MMKLQLTGFTHISELD